MNQTNTYKASSSQPYTKRDYYRDTRDRIYAWKNSTNNAVNPMENGRGDRYTYDPEGQLTAASYQATTPEGTPGTPQRTDSFVYDQLGNRKSPPNNQIASLPGTVFFNRRDNGLNQYLSWTQWGFNYDTNGNLYQEGWITAAYNALNQPLWIFGWRTIPSGSTLSFAHDPLGRCVTRTEAGGATTYLYYDGWSLIQEGPASGGWIWNGTGAVTAGAGGAMRVYVHGARVDEIVCSVAFPISFDLVYHHYDGSGHGLMLTDSWANILEQYQYDAFGKPYFYSSTAQPLNSSPFGNRFLFTGREWLSNVAVYDFRNRHYLPELGRFIQPDPLGFSGEQSANLHAPIREMPKSFPKGTASSGNRSENQEGPPLPLVAEATPFQRRAYTSLEYNLYRYCHNDPINKDDPFSLMDFGAEGNPIAEQRIKDEIQKRIEMKVSNETASAIRNALQKSDIPGLLNPFAKNRTKDSICDRAIKDTKTSDAAKQQLQELKQKKL